MLDGLPDAEDDHDDLGDSGAGTDVGGDADADGDDGLGGGDPDSRAQGDHG